MAKHDMSLSRRQVLAGTAAALASTKFPTPAIAQETTIKMTLPWLPQGSQLFPFVARNRGYWKSRGLNVEIARGFGSSAAIQTIVQGQMQAGIIAAPSVMVAAAQGLDTRVVGIDGYDSTMGFLVRADSPVKTLKDLEGRKLGSTVNSAEVPFIDQFLTLSRVDPKQVARVALQANVLETTLINNQVDAISVFATSNMPSLLTKGVQFNFFPYAAAGIRIYSNSLTVNSDYLKTYRSVVEAWVDGMHEGLKFSMLNFEDAVDIFVKEVPEVQMSSSGKTHTRYGAGLFLATLLTPEIRDHGLGWGDVGSLNKQMDLVMKYAVADGKAQPDVAAIFSNEMAGKIKLTPAEWETARKSAMEFGPLLSINLR
jgi:ABC-type nitrate/sulfonate/bicarbonate transport system substrate-binding protein